MAKTHPAGNDFHIVRCGVGIFRAVKQDEAWSGGNIKVRVAFLLVVTWCILALQRIEWVEAWGCALRFCCLFGIF